MAVQRGMAAADGNLFKRLSAGNDVRNGDGTVDLKSPEGLRCLKAIVGVADKTALELADQHGTSDRFVKSNDKFASQFLEFGVVSYFDPQFPDQFRDSMEKPVIEITFCGKLAVLGREYKRTAIIGSRDPSDLGIKWAEIAVKRAVEGGSIVVSGMAHGIDRAAHEACLAADGITLAFIPFPFNKPSPADRELIRQIAQKGCVVSRVPTFGEYNANAAPLDRNHLVVEASDEVVVIQAGASGGTLKTAGIALRRKRMLYALPPESSSDAWEGNSRLLDPEPDRNWARKELGLPKSFVFSGALATPYK